MAKESKAEGTVSASGGLAKRVGTTFRRAGDYDISTGERAVARTKIAGVAVAGAVVTEAGVLVGGPLSHLVGEVIGAIPLGEPAMWCGVGGVGLASAALGFSWMDAHNDPKIRANDRRVFGVAASITGAVTVASVALVGGADAAGAVGLPHIAGSAIHAFTDVGTAAAGLTLVAGITTAMYGRGRNRPAATVTE